MWMPIASCAVPCDSVSGRYCLGSLEKFGLGLGASLNLHRAKLACIFLGGFVTWSEPGRFVK